MKKFARKRYNPPPQGPPPHHIHTHTHTHTNPHSDENRTEFQMNTRSKDYFFINVWKLWKKILIKLTAHLFPSSLLCVEVHVPSSLLSLQATSNLPLPFLSLVKLTPSCSFTLFVFLSFFMSHSMSSINKIFYLLLYFSLTFSFF